MKKVSLGKKVSLLSLVLPGMLVLSACAPTVSNPELPDNAQKLSDVVPGMGEHWANPENLPIGPLYLVHDGEVIGIEYMFTTDLMDEITMATPEGEMVFKQLPGLRIDMYVNHMEIEFLPQGHEGFEEAHFDVHLYFISALERQELVPHEH